MVSGYGERKEAYSVKCTRRIGMTRFVKFARSCQVMLRTQFGKVWDIRERAFVFEHVLVYHCCVHLIYNPFTHIKSIVESLRFVWPLSFGPLF